MVKEPAFAVGPTTGLEIGQLILCGVTTSPVCEEVANVFLIAVVEEITCCPPYNRSRTLTPTTDYVA